MQIIDCPVCNNNAGEIINAGNRVRKGWYCEKCRHFEPAMFRERVL